MVTPLLKPMTISPCGFTAVTYQHSVLPEFPHACALACVSSGCTCTDNRSCASINLKSNGKNYRYDGHCRNLPDAEIKRLENENTPKVVRFKVEQGTTSFIDSVHGSLTFNNSEIEDFVILRSDNMPTYQLAVVVDDHEMNISTVIRGDDHISNTPKQLILYEALGWQPPQFAHVPLILGADKKRLSKRHGATSISAYKEEGYLPEAIVNFLALLCWSPGDNRELMNLNETIETFTLSGISPKSAIFNEQKLAWINDQYISRLSNEELADKIIPGLIEKKLINDNNINNHYIKKVVHLLKPKIKRLTDFADLGYYFFSDPETYDEKAKNKYWNDPETKERLSALYKRIIDVKKFDAYILEHELRNLAAELKISAAKLIHPIRLALTGFSVSPGIFELMEVLGKEIVLRRTLTAINVLS